MKTTMKLMATTCLTLSATLAVADGHMADEMTIVSWGGAYSSSQENAYPIPYAGMTGVRSTTTNPLLKQLRNFVR